MGNEISKKFNSTIGVKQRYAHSPSLFDLCIDKLEQMIARFVREKHTLRSCY